MLKDIGSQYWKHFYCVNETVLGMSYKERKHD